MKKLSISPLPGGKFRLLDSIGVPETVDFDSKEEAETEKVNRFIFKGAIGLGGSESYSALNDRISQKVRETLMTKDANGYCDGWVRDFDSEHVYYTDCGKTFAAPWTDSKESGITLGAPIEVRTKTVYEPATTYSEGNLGQAFSFGPFATFAGGKESKGLVTKEGKIFEAGHYPDKGVSVSEEELQAMVDGFTAVDNDLEHMDTVLDGKLGKLEAVWKKGKELFGKVSVPTWMAGELGNEPIKVSIALNREKKIVGNALVLNPRVSDACIMRAFSNSERRETGKKTMKVRDLLSIFGIGNAGLDDDLPEGAAFNAEALKGAASVPSADPEKTRLEAELATFRATEKARRTSAIEDAAKTFAKSMIEAGTVLPAAHDEVMTLFKSALISDGESGEVRFSESGSVTEGENVKALRKILGEKPKVGPANLNGATAFSGAPATGEEDSDAGADAVLKATPFGRKCATDKAAN